MNIFKYLLCISLTALICLPQTARCEEGDDEVSVSEIVFDHIEDAYEWHITDIGETSIRIPLLAIVKSSTGWHVFSTKHLRDGATYNGLYIAQEGNNEGKIVERNAIGEEQRPLDISITKNVLGLMINSALLLWIMLACARWYKRREVTDGVPKGGVGIIESIVIFINDEAIKPCIGDDYKRFAPYLLTVFFFILINNLMGIFPIFPGGANITGCITVTMILALCTFFITNLCGTKAYWKDIFWPKVPMWLKCPVPLLPFIELFGVFTKPFTLMIRLFANMMAGHVIILSLICIIFITAKMGAAINGTMTVVALLFAVFMDLIEVLVAFIQAFVFTLLSAVFIGMARIKEPETETTESEVK